MASYYCNVGKMNDNVGDTIVYVLRENTQNVCLKLRNFTCLTI